MQKSVIILKDKVLSGYSASPFQIFVEQYVFYPSSFFSAGILILVLRMPVILPFPSILPESIVANNGPSPDAFFF